MSEHSAEKDAPPCSCSVARVGDLDEGRAYFIGVLRENGWTVIPPGSGRES